MSRDEAISGIPIQIGDRLAIFGRSRLATAPTIRATAWIYDPTTNATSMMEAVLTMTTTDFSQESTGNATMAKLPAGSILTGVTLIGSSNTNPVGLWAAAIIFRGGSAANSMFLCDGYLTNDSTPCWPKGYAINGPMAGGKEMGALFTFQGTVVNGAGGAGDQSLTVTAAAGGRAELLTFEITNNDTVARASTLILDDGTNRLARLINLPSTGAGASIELSPSTQAADAPMTFAPPRAVVVGANRLVGTVAAVAASQDTAWAMTMRVWGAAPTCTLAGASTPTLTTNTSRFEAG